MNEVEKLCKEKTPKVFEDCKSGFFFICPHDSHRCAQLQEEEKQKLKEQEGASPAPGFSYLHKIYSIKKQLQIFDILQAIHPTHPERLWLAGFLKYAGYSFDEVLDIIHNHCEWIDYDPDVCTYQVATVYDQPHRKGNTSKRRVRKWDLTPTEEYRIKLSRSAQSHRELENWMQENDVPVYDAAPELEFDPAKLGGLEK